MLLRTKLVSIPAAEEIEADINEYGHIGNKCRAAYGQAACEAGAPDFGENDERTNAVDAIANILHSLTYYDPAITENDLEGVWDSALSHWQVETSGNE